MILLSRFRRYRIARFWWILHRHRFAWWQYKERKRRAWFFWRHPEYTPHPIGQGMNYYKTHFPDIDDDAY